MFGAALIAAVVSASGLAASTFVKSPAQLAADTKPPRASVLTAPVERRVLKNTLVMRATVAAGFSIEVTPTAAASAARLVVTSRRARQGQQLQAGDVLVEVSGRPVVALPGSVPAFRDLRPADDGKDVAQLQDALKALGLPAGHDRHGYFGPDTKTAVTRLYQRLGYDVPTTGGTRDGGDQQALAAAQDAVTAATRQRDAARTALVAAQHQGQPDAAARTALDQAQQDLDRAAQKLSDLVASTGPMMPLNEFVFIPEFPVRLAKLTAKVGDPVTAPLVTVEGGRLVAQALLQPGDEKQVKTGMPVTIDSELLGASATGTVTDVGALVAPAAGGNGAGDRNGGNDGGQNGGGRQTGGGDATATGYPMVVTPTDPLAATWSGQDVRLTIEAASTTGPVLVVPLAAVCAGADGRTTVTVLDTGGAQRRVPVRAGMSGSGYVEVTPVDQGTLSEADLVVVGT